jgi:hypothetical protein
MSSSSDWLAMTPEDFARGHSPHTARALPPPTRPSRPPPPPLPSPATRIATLDQPHTHTFNPIKENTDMDFAGLKLDRMTLQVLMQTPQDTLVSYNGKPTLISEVLRRMLKGEDNAPIQPPQPQPGTPQVPSGPTVLASQRAMDALSEADYQSLAQTGHIDGLTRPLQPTVSVRNSSGSVDIRRSFNADTGAIEAGRGLDMRDFSDPAAAVKK